MAHYGYVRISSKDQKPDRQLDAMRVRGIKEEDIFLDRMSGKDFQRPEYIRMLRKVHTGDCIVIKSIDRLGRDYGEILDQWRLITKTKSVDIEVIDMPLLNTTVEHNGLTGVFISDLVLQILAYVAETERSFIRQRQSEGIAAAHSRGVKFGRPKVCSTDTFEHAYELWNSGKLTSRDAAIMSGMSHSTFYRRCKEKQAVATEGFCSDM